jgi:hypothetical protein
MSFVGVCDQPDDNAEEDFLDFDFVGEESENESENEEAVGSMALLEARDADRVATILESD